MSDEIVFYYNPLSRGRIAHWMLEEIGAPYRFELLSFDKGDHKKSEYLAVNPMGKIPSIVHRGVVITETPAICAYLADAFPAAKLAPAVTDPLRGVYYRWLFFGAGCVDAAIVDRLFNRPPPERRAALGYGCYEDTFATLDKAVSSTPYLLGDNFTAADLYLSAQIGWGVMVKALEPRPAFLSYTARCSDRPAWQRFNQQATKLVGQMNASA